MTALDLAPHAEKIARALLGKPNLDLSQKNPAGDWIELRYRTKGALAIPINGDKAGTYYDHEAKAGGSLLGLICREKAWTEAEAFAWLHDELGIGDGPRADAKYRITGTWVYRDRDGEPLYRVVRRDAEGKPKKIHQERYDPATRTFSGKKGCMKGARYVPYRLDEWHDRSLVLIAEGEKKADALVKLGWLATCNAGGAGKFSPGFAPYFAGTHVVLLPDNDAAGRDHVRQVTSILEPVVASIQILELPGLPPKGDIINWLEAGGTKEKLRALIDGAPEATEVIAKWQPETKPDDGDDRLERLVEQAGTDPGAPFESEAIDFLAALRDRDKAAYERARARFKKAHVRIGALDAEVERRKPEATAEDARGKGKALNLPEPEPWPAAVDGADLIGDLVAQIRRFVILSDHAAIATAIWVIHTHAHDAAFISPRLTALSPTKRCGKSSLFRTLARMARRPLPTSNISPTAMFRVIEAANPTLFCDEMSSIGDQERATEIRGVVNSSHCRADAQVIRNVPVADGYEPRAFSTWAPMALAYIKHVDDQIRDRSILIPMQRKAPDQAVAQLRLNQDQGFGPLASKAARWASDHFDALRRADPDVPRELNDRAADNWRCLLAIADLAGGPWHDRARAAAVALSTDADDEDTIGVELLRDLQVVFDILKTDRLASEAIVAHLAGLEGRPWAEFGRAGKPITKHQLARLLKPFKLHPAVVRLADGTTPRGYKRESFAELWERYFQTATAPQPTASAGFSDFQTATPESDVAFRNRPKATPTANCGVVTVCEGPEAGKEGNGHANASFAPSADWFDVPPGAVLPPGCEIKMDMATGRQRARRERVGTCARCRANVYRDNMVTADGDVLLHVPCARLWGEQRARGI